MKHVWNKYHDRFCVVDNISLSLLVCAIVTIAMGFGLVPLNEYFCRSLSLFTQGWGALGLTVRVMVSCQCNVFLKAIKRFSVSRFELVQWPHILRFF